MVAIIGIWSSFLICRRWSCRLPTFCSLYNFYRFWSFRRRSNLDQKKIKKFSSHARAYVVVFQRSYVKMVKKKYACFPGTPKTVKVEFLTKSQKSSNQHKVIYSPFFGTQNANHVKPDGLTLAAYRIA